jgi:hypothetical protein
MHVPEDTPVDVTDEHNASAFRAVVADEWRTLIFSNVFHSIPARPADVEPGAPDRRPHLLALLGSSERHAIITRACKSLRNVHDAWDNFYNEPPFAQ